MPAVRDAFQRYNWSTLYDDLPATVVARGNATPPQGWEAALAQLATDVLLPGLASGALRGVFLGDEICCRSAACWPQLDAISARLRELLGPRALLYVNECASTDEWTFDGLLPAALDLVSIDDYRGGGLAEVGYARQFYEAYVLSLIHI